MNSRFGNKLLILSSLTLIVTLISCDNELSRDAAEAALKSLGPKLITRHIDNSYGPSIRLYESEYKNPNTYRHFEEPLDKLKAGGWVTYDKNIDSVQFFSQKLYGLSYDVHFTDKLKPFIFQQDQSGVEVVVAKREFDKVTGIAKRGSNTREVEFMTKVTQTQLASAFSLENHETEPRKESRTFILFDDGWRLD